MGARASHSRLASRGVDKLPCSVGSTIIGGGGSPGSDAGHIPWDSREIRADPGDVSQACTQFGCAGRFYAIPPDRAPRVAAPCLVS